MELATEADIYCPSIDLNGNYVDKMPSFANLANGIRCPCGTRKDKSYQTSTTFSAHLKAKTHQSWIREQNLNKSNFMKENIELKDTIKNQRLVIANLEKDLLSKLQTIAFLSEQLSKKLNVHTSDLLELD